MDLVKWLRKNNTKVMAVVVIVLMIGFIGGSSLSYLFRGSSGLNEVLAYYGNDIGIKRIDIMNAQKELDILKSLRSANILKALQTRFEQTPNLQALVLGELLFSDQRPSQEVIAYIQQTASQYQFRMSNKQINDLYKLKYQSYIYWFLLDKEAENAGFKVQTEAARQMLISALPQITQENYSDIATNLMNTAGLSEEEIATTFAKLLAVLQYSHAICSGQDLTIRQLKHLAASQSEGLNMEFVRFSAEDFIENLDTPSEEQISEQFQKYKEYLPNDISEENPYGFGYKLSDRVQLEYITLKLDDVKKIIKEPTFDEQREFYEQYKESAFTEQVLANPADPNSGYIEREKPFSEVADEIIDYLKQDKVTQKAMSILNEARTLADGKLQDFNDVELDALSIEERAKDANDYAKIAEQLSSNNDNIKIYNGITGELSAQDIQNDEVLGKLYIGGYVSQLNLARIAFSVEPFDKALLGSYETVRSKMYLSVQPLQDRTGEIMAMVRVVKAMKSSVPENIDVTFSKKTFVLDNNDQDSEKDTFSVKDNVIKDLKCLVAMDIAKEKANEFVELAGTDSTMWDNAIDKFNELYEQEYPKDPNVSDSNDPVFKMDSTVNPLTRLTKDSIATITQNQGSISTEELNNMLKKESEFIDIIFSNIPEDSNEADFEPKVIEFKPDLSYYAVKSMSLNHLWKEDYESIKSIISYRKDLYESQSLAIEQFNPANIIERMNFGYADEEDSSDQEQNATDANDE